MTTRINISVGAFLRKEDIEESECFTDVQYSSLYTLTRDVVYKLHKKKIKGGSLLKIISFELFTPESGKWRSLLTFSCDIPIDNAVDDNDNCTQLLGE